MSVGSPDFVKLVRNIDVGMILSYANITSLPTTLPSGVTVNGSVIALFDADTASYFGLTNTWPGGSTQNVGFTFDLTDTMKLSYITLSGNITRSAADGQFRVKADYSSDGSSWTNFITSATVSDATANTFDFGSILSNISMRYIRIYIETVAAPGGVSSAVMKVYALSAALKTF
jgi:hypothetical protein